MDLRDKNIRNLQKDDSIYKYIKLRYLCDILKNKKLYLSRVNSWEDVYENFYLKCSWTFEGKEGFLSTSDAQKNLFAQSWTLEKESDPMWRIYSNISAIDRNFRDYSLCYSDVAVKVKTSVDKLFNYVYPNIDAQPHCIATSFIGKVDYYSDECIEAWINNHNEVSILGTSISNNIIDSLFIKKTQFSYEKEVRLVIENIDIYNVEKGLIAIPIDSNLFDEFVFDPRLSDDDCEKIKELLFPLVGQCTMCKSDIYQLKDGKVIVNNK